MQYLKALLFVTVLSATSFAADVGIPEAGEDRVLTGGLTATEFFGRRAQPSTCRNAVNARILQSKTLKTELEALVAAQTAAAQLDVKEEQFVDFRKNDLLPSLEECGPCATQPMGSSGTWKISDGSCFVPGENADERNRAFDAAVQMLSNTKLFVRQRGGFESVLEFIPIDRRTGAFRPHIENIQPGTALDTFIAVRAPGNVAVNYLFENRVELRESANGLKEFIVRFTGLRQPDGFRPNIKDITLAGTVRTPSMPLKLNKVSGMWYVRNDGYYRYFTAADFGFASFFSSSAKDQEARAILLDTIQTLSVRGR